MLHDPFSPSRRTMLSLLAGAGGMSLVPGAALAQSTDLTKIHIGTPGGDANAGAWFAEDMGFFKKAGLDATVDIVRGSGAGGTAAVLGGALDVGEADLIALAAAREHGLPLVVLSPSGTYSATAPTTVLAVAKNSPLKTAKDLVGKTIAVLSLEGPSKVGTSAWLDKNGVSVTDVKLIEMPPTNMGASLERGVIDAATISEPYLTGARDRVRVFASTYDAIAPRFTISAWFTTADWVKKNPAAAKAFVTAMRESNAWANKPENHAASGEILAKHTSISADIIPKITRATYGDLFEVALAQPLIDAGAKYHSLAKSMPAKDMLSSAALTR